MLRDKVVELYEEIGSLIETIDKNPKYDLSMFELKVDSEDLLQGIFDLKNEIRYEIKWQQDVIKYCAQKTLKESLSSGFNKTSIKYYKNYYFVDIYGIPFRRRSFIITKNTDRKFEVLDNILLNYGSINAIDENSYFIVYKNQHGEFERAVHCKFDESLNKENKEIDLVNSSILPIAGKNLDIELGENLVSWSILNEGDKSKERFVLYDHKKSMVVVPEYTDIKFHEDNKIVFEVTNEIEVNGYKAKLQFLVSNNGDVTNYIMDVKSNKTFERLSRTDNDGNLILEASKQLESIYGQVRLELLELSKKGNKVKTLSK